jgi:hypothetical protein
LLPVIRAVAGFFTRAFFGALERKVNHMEATVISRGLRSNAANCATSNQSAAIRASVKSRLAEIESSSLLLRVAAASFAVSLLLLPGGVRALHQNGVGWEAWSFARFLILPLVSLHLLCCWIPLALRYFRPGECRDITAFFLATTALFMQALIAYGLVLYHSLWYGAAA